MTAKQQLWCVTVRRSRATLGGEIVEDWFTEATAKHPVDYLLDAMGDDRGGAIWSLVCAVRCTEAQSRRLNNYG